MVRLVTHNLLACHAKDCNTNNFPLVFQNVQLEIREAEFNPGFIQSFLPKIEWNALVKTAQEVILLLVCIYGMHSYITLQLGDTSLPTDQPEMVDDEFLKNLHHVLFEVRDF